MTPFHFSPASPPPSYLAIEPFIIFLKYPYSSPIFLEDLYGDSTRCCSLCHKQCGLVLIPDHGGSKNQRQGGASIIPIFYTGYIALQLILDHHQWGMETGWTMNKQWRKHYEEKRREAPPPAKIERPRNRRITAIYQKNLAEG